MPCHIGTRTATQAAPAQRASPPLGQPFAHTQWLMFTPERGRRQQTNDIDCVLLSTSPAAALVQASVAERQIALPPVSRELSVPITGSFDSETDRVVVGAFAMIR